MYRAPYGANKFTVNILPLNGSLRLVGGEMSAVAGKLSFPKGLHFSHINQNIHTPSLQILHGPSTECVNAFKSGPRVCKCQTYSVSQ